MPYLDSPRSHRLRWMQALFRLAILDKSSVSGGWMLCTKHKHCIYSFGRWIINLWPHLGHFSMILLLVLPMWSGFNAITVARSPAGLSQSRPFLHEGHLTKSLLMSLDSYICSIISIPITSFVLNLRIIVRPFPIKQTLFFADPPRTFSSLW